LEEVYGLITFSSRVCDGREWGRGGRGCCRRLSLLGLEVFGDALVFASVLI
jgi:hypothetical protein